MLFHCLSQLPHATTPCQAIYSEVRQINNSLLLMSIYDVVPMTTIDSGWTRRGGTLKLCQQKIVAELTDRPVRRKLHLWDEFIEGGSGAFSRSMIVLPRSEVYKGPSTDGKISYFKALAAY